MSFISYLRSTGNISLFGAFLFILYGASVREPAAGVIDHFKVGDVVNSILKPADFIRIHGNGWRLMNGAEVESTTDLRKLFPSQLIDRKNIPDARGVFLRGMNEGRSSGGDIESNRNVGSFQSDVVGSHSHTSIMRVYQTNTGGGPIPAIEAQTPLPELGKNPITIGPDGRAETRPRNIAIYVYIKVNEQ